MKIRSKLLLLLCGISLVPVGLTKWYDVLSLRALGDQIAKQSATALERQAFAMISRVATANTHLVDRERQQVEMLLQLQAQHAEQLLAHAASLSAPHYYAQDFQAELPELDIEFAARKFYRVDDGGGHEPIRVSMRHQVFVVAADAEHANVEADAQRLGPMTEFYRRVYSQDDPYRVWHYIVLDTGLGASYPGHGDYPSDFDPRARPWYQDQKREPRLLWWRPHIDASSRRLLTNATLPLRYADGTFAGITGIDVDLTAVLTASALPAPLGRGSEVMMTFITGPPQFTEPAIRIVARQTGSDTDTDWMVLPKLELLQFDDAAVNALLSKEMEIGNSGQLRTRYNDIESLVVYRAFARDGSYLIFIVPHASAVATAEQAKTLAATTTQRHIRGGMAALGILVLSVVALAVVAAAQVTSPLAAISRAVGQISQGDFTVQVRVDTGDELQHLGRALNLMVPRLEEHSRVRESLVLAREVQQNLLPQAAPVVPGYDVAGFSDYSEHIGGDYYDFIDLRDADADEIVILIGDVAGHGIASALLMTTVRAFFHGAALPHIDPPELLGHVNRQIASDLQRGRFVTLFCLTLNTADGEIAWASAGHDPALHYARDGTAIGELIGEGIPLGIDPNWHYGDVGRGRLEPGEFIFIGTDGIWDTTDPSGIQFGKPQLKNLLAANVELDAADMCTLLRDELERFRAGTMQRDDVTAVVIRRLVA